MTGKGLNYKVVCRGELLEVNCKNDPGNGGEVP